MDSNILEQLEKIAEEIGDDDYDNNIDVNLFTEEDISQSLYQTRSILNNTKESSFAIAAKNLNDDKPKDLNFEQNSDLEKNPNYNIDYINEALKANATYSYNLNEIKSHLVKKLLVIRSDIQKICSTIKQYKDLYQTTRKPFECALVCGAPYFKDADFFPAPQNVETFKAKKCKMLRYIDISNSDQWRKEEKNLLQNSVLENCRDVVISGLRSEIIKLKPRRNKATISEDDANNRKQKIRDIESKIQSLKNAPLKEIIQEYEDNFSSFKIDWESISVKKVILRTSCECRSMWEQVLHPNLSKLRWTNEDNLKLVQIARNHNYQDWDAIAAEFGGRSSFQCFLHFQQKLAADTLKEGKWTEEEDDYLRAVVDKCRIGTYVPWAQVCSYFDDRSKTQVFQRYTERLDNSIVKGTFTKEEACKLLAALSFYKELDKIPFREVLPYRTKAQARGRYVDVLQYIGQPQKRWTADEDSKLLKLSETMNKQWYLIADHFELRTRQMIRQRYLCLQRFLKHNDISELRAAPRKIPRVRPDITGEMLQDLVKDLKINKPLFVPEMPKLKVVSKKGRPRHKEILFVNTNTDQIISNIFRNVDNYLTDGPQKCTRLTKSDLKQCYETFQLLVSVLGFDLKFASGLKCFNLYDYDQNERDFLDYIVEKTNTMEVCLNNTKAKTALQPSRPRYEAKRGRYVDPFAYRDLEFQYTSFKTAGLKTYSRKKPTAAQIIKKFEQQNTPILEKDEMGEKALTVLPPNYATLVALKTMFLNKSNMGKKNDLILKEEDISVRKKLEEVLFQLFKVPGIQSFTQPAEQYLREISMDMDTDPSYSLASKRLNTYMKKSMEESLEAYTIVEMHQVSEEENSEDGSNLSENNQDNIQEFENSLSIITIADIDGASQSKKRRRSLTTETDNKKVCVEKS